MIGKVPLEVCRSFILVIQLSRPNRLAETSLNAWMPRRTRLGVVQDLEFKQVGGENGTRNTADGTSLSHSHILSPILDRRSTLFFVHFATSAYRRVATFELSTEAYSDLMACSTTQHNFIGTACAALDEVRSLLTQTCTGRDLRRRTCQYAGMCQ
ncbi:hypothetical protein DOTSEDRAFT_75974 [Dothistroma septosporum NZE10]|uniref:Uncharacterized protein n=1 Tax=Dothistroma septosporum (strain NZE10 / CBS 128990) TaxID=675120 RepID=M2XZL9_DOTSN|nr:hypothetical protein DOTSEDRAFT_75974 [Dothistroma septosporum NZE10]